MAYQIGPEKITMNPARDEQLEDTPEESHAGDLSSVAKPSNRSAIAMFSSTGFVQQ